MEPDYRLIAAVLKNQAEREQISATRCHKTPEQKHERWMRKMERGRMRAKEQSRRLRAEKSGINSGGTKS